MILLIAIWWASVIGLAEPQNRFAGSHEKVYPPITSPRRENPFGCCKMSRVRGARLVHHWWAASSRYVCTVREYEGIFA
ncbi:hypothetical protein F5X98DRAFT_348089 [Xylaria grammica]|nr:hypothetical protein F5X98DRAFT_348089 [Xylaria grammica]